MKYPFPIFLSMFLVLTLLSSCQRNPQVWVENTQVQPSSTPVVTLELPENSPTPASTGQALILATKTPTPDARITDIPTWTTWTPQASLSSDQAKAKVEDMLKRGYLVTSELGPENQDFSIVRYYDENNNLSNELTIQRRVIEVRTTEDGRFLAYYGEGKWVGASFKNYDGFYIMDTVTGQETELNYQNCTEPAAWGPATYRLAVSCGDLIVIAFVDHQWVEEGRIPLPDKYNSMPVELRPQLISPAWSPDGKSIAYIQDNSANKPGAASGPFISDTACITDRAICTTKTRALDEPVSATSVLSWSADGSELYVANTEGEEILEISTGNFRVNRAFHSDEEIYTMVWIKEKECFLFSRAIGSFKRQSLYRYCLGNNAATTEITDGGYLVGILNKN